MTARALVFGSVAAAYERYRPGYPDASAAAILAYARRPIRTALEIGAGTGKATRLFASHGVAVTAAEPDPLMVAELRKHVPSSVAIMDAAFEDLAPTPAFDLVYAAAALHWTSAEGRWPRVAAMLRPGGVFASFGGPPRLADPHLADAVRSARSPWLADDDVPSPDGTPETAEMQWPGTELTRSELFTDVRQLRFERRSSWSADDYIGLLSTTSAYLQLDEPVRSQVFAKIIEVLPDSVQVASDIEVHLARLE